MVPHFRTLFMVGTIRRREKLSCDVLPRSIRLDWLRLTILELSQLVLLLEGWEDPSIHQYVTRDPSMPLSTRWRIYFEKLHPILHHDATVWCGSIRILFYHHPRRPSSTPSSYSGSFVPALYQLFHFNPSFVAFVVLNLGGYIPPS